jgi:hypothetical protein
MLRPLVPWGVGSVADAATVDRDKDVGYTEVAAGTDLANGITAFTEGATTDHDLCGEAAYIEDNGLIGVRHAEDAAVHYTVAAVVTHDQYAAAAHALRDCYVTAPCWHVYQVIHYRKLPLNFQRPRLADKSYVIFIGGRRKLRNFHLLIFNGQGSMEDKVKPTEKCFFHRFCLIFYRPLAVRSSTVSCSDR